MESSEKDTSVRPIGSHLGTRLTLLRKTIPRTDRRLGAKGRKDTCKKLAEHKRFAEQLRKDAQCETERAAVAKLVKEIDEKRTLLLAPAERENRKQKRSPAQVAAALHMNEYLKCEGQNRLLLWLLNSGDIGCDIGFLPSLEEFWSRMILFLNDRLDFYRTPGSAVREVESTEVKQIFGACVKHRWLVLTHDKRGFSINVTHRGKLALRGDVPPPIDISKKDAVRLILQLLKRARSDGALKGDPRIRDDGIDSKDLRTWVMNLGLSSDSFRDALDLILTEGFVPPGLPILRINPKGENQLGARKPRNRRDEAERRAREYLSRNSDATGAQVAEALGCSEPFVNTLTAWKETRPLRETQKRSCRKPRAMLKAVESIIEADSFRSAQLRDKRAQEYALIDEVEERERELQRHIGEYEKRHPGATVEETASAVACTPSEVKERRARLAQLIREQSNEAREDCADQRQSGPQKKKRKVVIKYV